MLTPIESLHSIASGVLDKAPEAGRKQELQPAEKVRSKVCPSS